MSWQAAAITIVFLMVPFANTFPIVYGVVYPWHRTAEGRAIFTFSASFALLVDFATLYQLFPNAPLRPVVATGVYACLLCALVAMNTSLALGLWRRYRKS